jgi:UDP-N-acetylmuramoyl-L-alanyl-D-glutamate--2,6-diaminopimelate ligase
MDNTPTVQTLQILKNPSDAVHWLRAHVTGTLQTDSRLIAPGDGFIAWPGAATDGRAHVADALARGASVCLVEQAGVTAFGFVGEHIATLAHLKAATGLIAAEWFGAPTRALDVVAFTGTNGKTSSAWWLAGALSPLSDAPHALSKKELLKHSPCGLVGTLGMGISPQLENTGMTTPDPVRLQRAFAEFAKAGVRTCAIKRHRLAWPSTAWQERTSAWRY